MITRWKKVQEEDNKVPVQKFVPKMVPMKAVENKNKVLVKVLENKNKIPPVLLLGRKEVTV